MVNDYIFELLKNNTFNLKILNETLWDIKALSYANLYRAQQALAGIERIDIDLSTYTKESNNRYVYNVAAEFISKKQRLAFRESRFYKKDINLSDISKNTNIFSKMPIVFINGELYTNIFVRANEDVTSFVFKIYHSFSASQPSGFVRDGFTKQEIEQMITNGGKMTVFLLPLSYQENRTDLNIYTVKNYTFKEEFLGLPITDGFVGENNIKRQNTFLAFMTCDDARLYKYKLLNNTYSNNRIYFNGDQINTFTNIKTFIKLHHFINNLTEVHIAGSDNYFELQIQDMPVPVENMIIFRKTNNNLYFDHDTTIKIHYPNIYEIIKNHTDDIVVYVYYSDDTASVGSKYSNEIKLYYRFTKNILDKYELSTIPELIKNWKPIDVKYSIKDFETSEEYQDHLLYKINRFKQLIKLNGEYYSNYLSKLVGDTGGYYVYVENIDLDTRIRHDNKTEIKDSDLHETFDEPHYLFIFRHDSNNDKMDIFLDNYHINPKTYTDEKYKYVYIPVKDVKPNSIIEIEKLYDVEFREPFNFTVVDQYIRIDIPKEYKISINDLFLSYKSGPEEYYIPETDYEIYIFENGTYNSTDLTSFYVYNTIYIKFINNTDKYLNKEVFINANRINFVYTLRNANSKDIDIVLNNDERNFQIFKNGRLLPYTAFKIKFADTIDGPHNVKGLSVVGPEDTLDIVYTQNKRIPIYYQGTIDSSGLVNLTGKIDKPIDLKWYDIYLNGLKLNKTNIDLLTPYRLTVKGIPTLTNFIIYQKNLDTDPFGVVPDDIGDKLIDLIPELKEEIESTLPEITDEIPDITDDVVYDVIGFLDEYLYTFGLLNPDTAQITDEMIFRYPFLFDELDNLFINPDTIISMEDDKVLNPDIQFPLK